MTKVEFLQALRKRLSALPRAEAEERLRFYGEMIEDRMEEGLSEAEAVAAVGSVEEIAAQILREVPGSPETTDKNVWIIVLLVLGFPVWFPLLISGFAVVLSLYVSWWAVVISLWAVFGSFIGCGIAGLVGGTILAISTHASVGLALVAAGLVCCGLAIFLFFGCKALTGGTVSLTETCFRYLRKKKEAV